MIPSLNFLKTLLFLSAGKLRWDVQVEFLSFFDLEARGILVPKPGIEPMSSPLAGRFFTIGPPGKSLLSGISVFRIK